MKIDYDSLGKLGAIMGSGGLIVIGNNRCMVETARYFLNFTRRESCGKCTFCRVGTTRMYEALERITSGKGTMDDVTFLEDIAPKIKKGALCGLGQTAPNPALSTLRYFKNEYLAHVQDHVCEALACPALVDVAIDPANNFSVDNAKCTKCNSCIEVCPKKAVSRVRKQSVQA